MRGKNDPFNIIVDLTFGAICGESAQIFCDPRSSREDRGCKIFDLIFDNVLDFSTRDSSRFGE